MATTLPPFEQWQAPWEVAGEEPDADRLKRHLYNLTRDKQNLQGKVDNLAGERDSANARVTELEGAAGKFDAAKYRLELAVTHGLSLTQAKRLVGDTQEELDADVEVLSADLGLKKKVDEKPVQEKNPLIPNRAPRTGNEPPASEQQAAVETDPAKFANLFT